MTLRIVWVLQIQSRAVVGTGAAGAIAPVNFKQRVHAPVLKRVVECFSNTKSRKSLVQSAKLQNWCWLRASKHFKGGFVTPHAKQKIFCTRPVRAPATPLGFMYLNLRKLGGYSPSSPPSSGGPVMSRSTHEWVNLTKFDDDLTKIVDFLQVLTVLSDWNWTPRWPGSRFLLPFLSPLS